MMNGPEIAKKAKEQLFDLTGQTVDSISGLAKEDNGWVVTIEMIDLKRIPDSADLLVSYEVHLDFYGNLLNYRRIRRYVRHQMMEEVS